MKAVILAGGKGTRLRPFTTHFPKPLMPLGDKPILEVVLNQLKDNNFHDILIATGHLEEMIRVFMGDGSKFGVNITYSKEEEPLGTAGPLYLVKESLNETFLLMNGDILTDFNFAKMMEYHKKNEAVATVGLYGRTVQIDFGVVTVNDDKSFATWREKPEIDYLVSTGIYILEPKALDYIPANSFFNLPDLIDKISSQRERVMGYIHDGYWLDIGRAEDYAKACEDYERKFKC